ncbi:MAG: type II methionyl aminopeptidase [Candidatus Micrarchaeota archaeon]
MAIEDYEKAGKIAREVLEAWGKKIKPGVKLLEIAEGVEGEILSKGGSIAFPVNISLNEQAAHYTPEHKCEKVFGEKDLVKLDVGVHVNGFIGDTALSIDLSGEQGKLLEASEAGLAAAIAGLKPGVEVGEIGALVEAEIKKMGFKPIENLTGHKLEQFNLHAGTEIPNIRTSSPRILQEGDVFAVEPFATNGAGHVSDGSQVEIFMFMEKHPVRLRESRRLSSYADEKFKGLPFAERWLYKDFNSKLLLASALRELVGFGVLRAYPVLSDTKKGLVSQAEKTVIIEKDGARVLTK